MTNEELNDRLADLTARLGVLFSGYESWRSAMTDFMAGTLDDPDSFDKDGGKAGPLGYYPVRNANDQIVYVPCFARIQALAAGGGTGGASLPAVEALITSAGLQTREVLRRAGWLTSSGADTGAVEPWQFEQALYLQARHGVFMAALGALPPGSPVRNRYAGNAAVAPGDPVANFARTALGYTAAQMTDLFALARVQLTATPPTLSISAPVVLPEGNTGTREAVWTITRNATAGRVEVPYAVALTSMQPADFPGDVAPPGGVIVIPDGEASGELRIAIKGDTQFEADELLTVTLGETPGYLFGERRASTLTVTNDDQNLALPTISFAEDVALAEGPAGQSRPVTLTLLRTSVAGAVPVTLTFNAGATNAADYPGGVLPGSVTLTFPDGQPSVSFTYEVAGDDSVEPDELSSWSIAAMPNGYAPGAKTSASVRIVNDDVAQGGGGGTPTVTLSAPNVRRLEGAEGTFTAIPFTVDRSTTVGTGVVRWEFVPLTAEPAAFLGGVYPSGGTITIPSGSSSGTGEVVVAGNGTTEPDKTYRIRIIPPTGYVAGPVTELVFTIENDDIVLPTIEVSVSPQTQPEGNTGLRNVTHTFRRSSSIGSLLVSVAFVPNAMSPNDFAGDAYPTQTTVQFADGQSEVTIVTQVKGESTVELNESFGWRITQVPTGYIAGTALEAFATIENDDVPTVSISAPPTVPEGNAGTTLVPFTIERSSGLGEVDVVLVFNAGGMQPTDFPGDVYPTPAPVRFLAGELSKVVQIAVKADNLVESNEPFSISLVVPTGYAAGAATTATVTITNDDTDMPDFTLSGTSVVNNWSVPLVGTFSFTNITDPRVELIDETPGFAILED